MGLFLLKMAFFILKVEEETAEAAETDAEGITCSSMMPNWDEVKQGVQYLVWGENPASSFLLSGSRQLSSLQRGPAWAVRAFHWGKVSCGHSTMAILALSGAGSDCVMLSPVD